MNDENIVGEEGTNLFKCKSISLQVGAARANSVFSIAKTGYVRLRQDKLKMSYVIEFYHVIKPSNGQVNLKNPQECQTVSIHDIHCIIYAYLPFSLRSLRLEKMSQ